MVRDTMFILGGLVEGEMTSSVELWNEEKKEWQASTDMPEVAVTNVLCIIQIDCLMRFLPLFSGIKQLILVPFEVSYDNCF